MTLISVRDLLLKLNSKKMPIVLDCSWNLGGFKGREAFLRCFPIAMNRNPFFNNDLATNRRERIPGARFLDLEEVIDKTSALPHMVPSRRDFAREAGKLGLQRTDELVFYDCFGIFSAPRIWWMFLRFNHPPEKLFVLDGGLPAWKAYQEEFSKANAVVAENSLFHVENGKLKVESGEETSDWKVEEYDMDQQEGKVEDSIRKEEEENRVISYEELLPKVINFASPKPFLMLDARSEGRFSGKLPEPREGLSSGHAPASKSLPFGVLLTKEGKFKEPQELMEIFKERGLNLKDKGSEDVEVVTSCGSGVTAAIIYLALDICGKKRNLRMYDGSWSEWASRRSSPIQRDV